MQQQHLHRQRPQQGRRPDPGAGLCDGTSPWDENTPGELGWHCRDQIGTGRDQSLWSHSPPAAWDQELKPAYLWGNTRSGGIVTAAVSPVDRNPLHIQADREYYDHSTATGSPQTTGVRVGILADRPADCTAGVAYWATDEGEWNSLQVGPDGRLHKCVSTNNWSVYYTPYAYPHPWTLPACAMSIRPLTLPTGRVGHLYSQSFTASGGSSPVRLSQSRRAAGGPIFDAGTGLLSGTPTQIGNFAITVERHGQLRLRGQPHLQPGHRQRRRPSRRWRWPWTRRATASSSRTRRWWWRRSGAT